MPPTIHSQSKGGDGDKRLSYGARSGGSRGGAGGGGGSSSRGGERRPDLISRIKYTNTLPDIPFDPKFIQYPFDTMRFVTYKETSLEKNFKWELHTEYDLGVTIDLVDPETYSVPPTAALHQDDERLLEDDAGIPMSESKRSKLHQTPASWLRKTEYMSAEYNRSAQTADKSEARIGYRIRKQMDDSQMYKDRDAQIETITKTFEVAKQTITTHHSKPGVTPIEVLPVFPDFQMWGLPCAQVIFDSDPAPTNQPAKDAEQAMSEAIIRGMMDDSGEQFVAYFLPTDETSEKRKKDVETGIPYDAETEYEYRLAKEYNWTVKHKGSRGYEQSYFCVVRPDGVYYNELETRVRLSRRKMDVGKKSAMTTTKLMLKHRPFDQQELEMQEQRMTNLEPVAEGEGEDDEDEDEEEDEVEGDGNKEDEEKGAAQREESGDEKSSSDSEVEDKNEKGESSGDEKSASEDDAFSSSAGKDDGKAGKDDEKVRKEDAASPASSEDEEKETKEEVKNDEKDADEIFGSSSSENDSD